MNVCLVMIVKDEAERIERALESVVEHIDSYCICDTGSMDGTPTIVRQFMERNRVPGHLHQVAWKDFGKNRSECMRLAENSLRIRPDALFFLDADDTVKFEPGFEWPNLANGAANAGAAHVDHNGIFHLRPHLFLADGGWYFKGSTHEVATRLAGGANVVGIPGMTYVDGQSSRATPARFALDEELLRKDLEANPKNPRAQFYLAKTVFDSGLNFELAFRLFKDRAVNTEGWDEEQWYASYMMVLCCIQLKDPAEVVLDGALRSFALRPSRCEPLVAACKYLHEDPRALPLALAAAALQLPSDQLFVEPALYAWGAVECAYVAACACENYTLALQIAKRALRTIPESERERTLGNVERIQSKLQSPQTTI